MELADEGDVHAAHEAELAGLAGERRGDADQVAALMLLEDILAQIGAVEPRDVDDRELAVGELGRNRVDGVGLREADRNHHGRAALHEPGAWPVRAGFR